MLDVLMDRITSLKTGLSPWSGATWAPLKHNAFRTIWMASAVSNLGGVIQTVGAAWLMTSIAKSPDMVALVQTAATAPMILFSLFGGALADISNRRVLMICAQALAFVSSVVLAVMGFYHLITPIWLLAFTFLIGSAAALYQPAWQASVGDLVPRTELPAAVALNSLSFNLARSTGPALGGALVALAGAPFAFAINAASYTGLLGALFFWKHRPAAVTLPPESIGAAMMTGLRYVYLSPALNSVVVRGALFGFCAAALWALMPLIARDRLDGGALHYGALLGAFGAGSTFAATMATRLRQRLGGERLSNFATLAYAAANIVAGLSVWTALSMLATAIAGFAWILVMATRTITVQMSSPRWVVGRAVAVSQATTLGGLAAGAAFWGVVTREIGVPMTFVCAAAALAASLLISHFIPLREGDETDLTPADRRAQEPKLTSIDDNSGPVLIELEYRVRQGQTAPFLEAVYRAGRIRRRDGARRWRIYQDIDDPDVWRETFQSSTWVEHMRRVTRMTKTDQMALEAVLMFVEDAKRTARRMIERPPGADPLE